MKTWIVNNFGFVMTLFLLVASFMTQWNVMVQAVERINIIEQEFRRHENDSRVHRDPDRDERRWQDLMLRLDRIERKIDDRDAR